VDERTIGTDGATALDRLPKAARKRKTAPVPTADKPKGKPAAAGRDPLQMWANAGIGLTLALSGVLNGYANAEASPVAWAGWLMGMCVPALVLILSRVGGLAWKRGRRNLAKGCGAVALALLVLSVWHCAVSVAALTGSPLVLGVLMAIGIDCGLVACELATIDRR
jgi:hypothetical protein